MLYALLGLVQTTRFTRGCDFFTKLEYLKNELHIHIKYRGDLYGICKR